MNIKVPGSDIEIQDPNRLSPNFTLEQMIYSETAIEKQIDNTPNAEQRDNLKQLCNKVLEPIYTQICKFDVSSGFRGDNLNKVIPGASTGSAHKDGQASDIVPIGKNVEEVYKLIKKSNIPFTKMIHEFSNWIHISYDKTLFTQPRVCYRATKGVKGNAVYTLD